MFVVRAVVSITARFMVGIGIQEPPCIAYKSIPDHAIIDIFLLSRMFLLDLSHVVMCNTVRKRMVDPRRMAKVLVPDTTTTYHPKEETTTTKLGIKTYQVTKPVVVVAVDF
jgi:hypothetical protein